MNSLRFDEVLRGGNQVHSGNVYFSVLDNDLDHSRFAIVVPKKVLRKAFDRHKLKRQVNHIMKDIEANLPSKDYIVFVKKGIVDISPKDIKDELTTLSGRIVA